MNSLRALVSFSFLSLFASLDRAQCELEKLTAADGTAKQLLGEGGAAAALSGNTLLLGAPDPSAGPGAAYVYERTPAGFVQVQKLQASDGLPGNSFGRSVCLAGDTAIVGASSGFPFAVVPAVYVFERTASGFAEVQKLAPPGLSTIDRFGGSVSLFGDTLLVGASGDDDAIGEAGAAYVFERDPTGAFLQTAKLTAFNAASGDFAGFAVAMSKDFAFVGAPGQFGSVYVFRRTPTGFAQTQKLGFSSQFLSNFGRSVAVSASGENVVVGAPSFDHGRVFSYRLVGPVFVLSQTVAPPDSRVDLFGHSVSLSADNLLVGAPGLFSATGAAFAFEQRPSGFVKLFKLSSLSASSEDHFGSSVATLGDTAVATSPGDDDLGQDSGSTSVFSLSGVDFTSLVATPAALSLQSGGIQTFDLRTCASFAGRPYLLLGSVNGSSPGIPIDDVALPLNFDFQYLLFTLLNPNTQPLADSFGALDGSARAQASFTLPASSNTSLVGLRFHHAYLVFDIGPSGKAFVAFASNASLLTLQP